MDRLLEATRQAEQVHFWFRGFRQFVRPLVAAAAARQPAPRILDCGCGTGANLRMLGAFGSAFGFDITWRGLEFARDYEQRRLAQASATHIPFADGAFDIVTAFDVLYALRDEDEGRAVAEMHRVLRPGGTLIVNVAALDILRGSHSVFGAEVRRSTRSRLERLLTGHGFVIDRATYTNFTLFPLMLAVRTAQRAIGVSTAAKAAADIAVPTAPVNAFLSALLTLEAAALRFVNMPIGSSILCVAHKPR